MRMDWWELGLCPRLIVPGPGQAKEDWFVVSFIFHHSEWTLHQSGAAVNPQADGIALQPDSL
jgi:hypothetical protein